MVHREVALLLYEAMRSRRAIEPLSDQYPGMSVADAYRIQHEMVEMWKGPQGRVVGHKVGLTSRAMQQLLNVHEPDFGCLVDSMIVPEGTTLSAGDFLLPRVEAEIAFVLDRDLSGPGVSGRDVIRASAAVMPSIEVIDSRIAGWKIKIQDTVADNGSSARAVPGSVMTSPYGLDLRLIGMMLEEDGEMRQTAAGAAAWGDPAMAVAWLANKLAEFGETLKAGEVILSGSLGSALTVRPGSTYRATFDRLGSVSIAFVA
jgi:2-keto-4-pentenoate hydratase